MQDKTGVRGSGGFPAKPQGFQYIDRSLLVFLELDTFEALPQNCWSTPSAVNVRAGANWPEQQASDLRGTW